MYLCFLDKLVVLRIESENLEVVETLFFPGLERSLLNPLLLCN